MASPTRLRYVLPSLHLLACAVSYIGLLIPGLQFLGILFPCVLLVDLPISIVTYLVGMVYPTLGLIWILGAGTAWWYLLGRGLEALLLRFTRRDEPTPRLIP
jgi:hypothetical protein